MNLGPAHIVSRNDCVIVLWIAASTYIITLIGFNLTIRSMRRNGMTTIFAGSLNLIIFTHLYQAHGNTNYGMLLKNLSIRTEGLLK